MIIYICVITLSVREHFDVSLIYWYYWLLVIWLVHNYIGKL